MQWFLMEEEEEDNKDEWSLAPSIVSLNEFVGINHLVEEFMMMMGEVFPPCVIAKGGTYRLKFNRGTASNESEAYLISKLHKH